MDEQCPTLALAYCPLPQSLHHILESSRLLKAYERKIRAAGGKKPAAGCHASPGLIAIEAGLLPHLSTSV